MARVIVCLSGGIDSAVITAKAKAEHELVECVFFDYGQSAMRLEWGAAGRVASLVGAPLVKVGLHKVFRMEAMLKEAGPGPRVVPFRNVVFATVAAAGAVGRADSIWIGATKDDGAAYWDCKVDTALALSQILTNEGVRVKYPLAMCSKAEVVGLAHKFGVPLEVTWSCYCPIGSAPCGRCNACIDRAQLAATGG